MSSRPSGSFRRPRLGTGPQRGAMRQKPVALGMTTLLFVGLLQSGTNALTVASVDAATATLAAAAPPAYPVKVGPTGRYLVDRNGHPFLIAGESLVRG